MSIKLWLAEQVASHDRPDSNYHHGYLTALAEMAEQMDEMEKRYAVRIHALRTALRRIEAKDTTVCRLFPGDEEEGEVRTLGWCAKIAREALEQDDAADE